MPGGTPYVTPNILRKEPLGVAWSTLPDPNAEATEEEAIITQLCWEATYEADSIVQQTIRATIDVDTFLAPNPGGYGRASLDNQGVCKVIATRWPILQILSGQVSPHASFPAQWSPIAANQFKLGTGLLSVQGSNVPGPGGAGTNIIFVAPGYVTWGIGRGGYDLQITYINGWPHTSLTQAQAAGDLTLHVDDCTGFAAGGNTICTVMDGEITETVTVDAASAASGAGTLTLNAGLVNAHDSGTIVTAFPSDVVRAVALLAGSYAVDRGAATLSVQEMPGSESHGGGDAAEAMKSEAEILLHPYGRVV